jgi:hypothetical protein
VGVGGFVKCKLPKVFPIKYHHTDVSDTSMYISFVENISLANVRRLKVVKNGQLLSSSGVTGICEHPLASVSSPPVKISWRSYLFYTLESTSNIAQPKWFQCLTVRLQLKSWTSPYCRFNVQRSHPIRKPQHTTCISEQMHPKCQLQTLHENFFW